MERYNDPNLFDVRARAMLFLNNGIVITDATLADNPIIDCNPAFEVQTGYTRAEVLGQSTRLIMGEKPGSPGALKIRDAVHKQEHVTVVVQTRRKDGTKFWNELSISPIFDDTGKLTNFLGVQHDISAQIAATEELTRRHIELEQSNLALKRQAAQRKDLDKRIEDLLRQAHP